MTALDIDLDKRAGELSTDEVNKIETVSNNSCQFKIPVHMFNRNSAHDITVVYNVTEKESFDNVKAWMGGDPQACLRRCQQVSRREPV